MICPRCNTELEATEFAGVRIETCPKCGGSWFDRDEVFDAKATTWELEELNGVFTNSLRIKWL